MSGLATFFQDFLPDNKNQNRRQPVDYEVSLLEHVAPTTSEQVETTANDDDAAAHEEELNWEAWKKKRWEPIAKFMEHRILNLPGDHDDHDDEEMQDADTAAAAVHENSQESGQEDDDGLLETQQEFLDTTLPPPVVSTRPPKVPHMDETTHAVQYLSDIDMHSKTVDLALCLVEKVWAHRKVKRPALQEAFGSNKHVMHTSNSSLFSLDRFAHATCEEDGPLASVYKTVLSVEVCQLDRPDAVSLRQRAEHVMQDETTLTAKRIKVFFYNSYAATLSQLLQSIMTKKNAAVVIMSIQGLGPSSVLPFAPADWVDRHDLSECCLCVGDDSAMRVEEEGKEGRTRIRFDAADLTLTVGWANAQGKLLGARRIQRVDDDNEASGKPVIQSTDLERGAREELQALVTQYYVPPVTTTTTSPSRRSGSPSKGTSKRSETAFARENAVATAAATAPPPSKTRRVDTSTSSPATAAATAVDPSGGPATPSRSKTVVNLEGSAVPSPRKDHIKHEKLNDLGMVLQSHESLAMQPNTSKPASCLVNLYGVVLGFNAPYLTKRGDWMMSVALVDESFPLEETETSGGTVRSININIFTKSRDTLPNVLYAGDVLRCHRVKLQRWKDDLQLMGMRQSSYVVFRGQVNDPSETNEWTILPTSKLEFSLVKEDQERFVDLWIWAQKRLLSYPSMRLSLSFQLCDMKLHDSTDVDTTSDATAGGDLTVMVGSIVPVPPNQRSGVSPRGFLRVWDGTGLPASDPMPPHATYDMLEDGDPPMQAIVKLAAVVRKLQFVRQNPSLDPPKALTGRVVNVAIWEDSHWDIVNAAVTPGSFIRLRNVQDTKLSLSNIRCLMVHSKSSLTPLPNLSHEVVYMLERHNERLMRNEPLNPQSGILPLDEGASLRNSSNSPRALPRPTGYTTIQSLLTGPIPTEFTGRVRILGILPKLSIIDARGLELICPMGTDGTRSYRFAVQIQDASGRADVICGGAGEKIVGVTAANAVRDGSSALNNIRRVLANDCLWRVRVRSVAFEGSKFFVLDSIEESFE